MLMLVLLLALWLVLLVVLVLLLWMVVVIRSTMREVARAPLLVQHVGVQSRAWVLPSVHVGVFAVVV